MQVSEIVALPSGWKKMQPSYTVPWQNFLIAKLPEDVVMQAQDMLHTEIRTCDSNNFLKSHCHREKKIAHVAAALRRREYFGPSVVAKINSKTLR